MTVPESRRHDLYNGLNNVLGSELTDTLMAYLPTSPAAALATKRDVENVHTDVAALRTETRTGFTEMRAEFKDLRTELKGDIRLLTQRMDRMHLTLLGGFISMIVALVVAISFG